MLIFLMHSRCECIPNIQRKKQRELDVNFLKKFHWDHREIVPRLESLYFLNGMIPNNINNIENIYMTSLAKTIRNRSRLSNRTINRGRNRVFNPNIGLPGKHLLAYTTWKSMLNRCYNSKSTRYK